MLGISLDSETVSSRCICSVSTECRIGKDCECCLYCKGYESLYNTIASEKHAWLTFAPPPPKSSACIEFAIGDRATEEYKEFKRFVKNFLKKSNVTHYIAVAELTAKAQIHYHVFFSFKNKVSVYKQIVQPLYFQGNVTCLYTKPKEGIHYLFKQSDSMTEYFNSKKSIFDCQQVDTS